MKIFKLYRCLLLSVLLALGCGGKDSTDTADERAAVVEDGASQESARNAASKVRSSSDEKVVLFLGDSITAGYGLDQEQAFPALIQERIDSLGWDFQVRNAGLSGETSAGGLRRVEWLLREPADVLVIELGGNDGLRGIPVEATKENLRSIIRKARDINPDMEIILGGMQIPPNLGHTYTERFRSIYPELAAEEDVQLIPFVLESVGGVPSLNLPDGIHPTAEGHGIVAQNVWEELRPVLESIREEPIQATH